MVKSYYDCKNNCYWKEEDLVDITLTDEKSEDVAFYRSPDGYYIFLSPRQLHEQDEYRDDDPYAVEENLDGEFHQIRISVTLDLIRKAIGDKKAPNILDVGCGKGYITQRILENFPNASITGLDYACSAIEYAHQKFPGIDFVVGDAYFLPFPPDSCDLVVCNNLWEHVPDPLRLLEAINRVIRPNGFLIISTPSRYRIISLTRKLFGRPIMFMSSLHVTEYTVGQVQEQLQYGGFQVIETASQKLKAPSLKYRLAYLFFSVVQKLLRSGNCLESTVFYLAKKQSPSQ